MSRERVYESCLRASPPVFSRPRRPPRPVSLSVLRKPPAASAQECMKSVTAPRRNLPFESTWTPFTVIRCLPPKERREKRKREKCSDSHRTEMIPFRPFLSRLLLLASLFFTMATNRDKGKESLHSPQNSENLKMIQFYNFFLFTLVREWRIEKMFEAWFPPSTRRRARGRRRRESEARSRPGSVTLENMRISDRNSSVFEAAQHFVTHRCSGGGGSLVVRKLSRLWNCGL